MERLVGFLYTLMRDEVCPGGIEAVTREAEKISCNSKSAYSNTHLEAYARELALRLLGKA